GDVVEVGGQRVGPGRSRAKGDEQGQGEAGPWQHGKRSSRGVCGWVQRLDSGLYHDRPPRRCKQNPLAAQESTPGPRGRVGAGVFYRGARGAPPSIVVVHDGDVREHHVVVGKFLPVLRLTLEVVALEHLEPGRLELRLVVGDENAVEGRRRVAVRLDPGVLVAAVEVFQPGGGVAL